MDILTFDEIVEIAKKHELENLVGYGLPGFANAVIAVVLTKVRSAEPVAYQYLFSSYYGDVWRNDSAEWNGNRPKANRPLYTHPAPSEGNRRDALTEDDVFTIGGYAEILRATGKEDMPKYFNSLAERIARVIGKAELAERFAAMSKGQQHG